MTFDRRRARVRALARLDERAKQFRGREEIWPFRVPHEPLALMEILTEETEAPIVDAGALRGRSVMRLEWPDNQWEAWTIAVPSGLTLYCDDDGAESRVLASIRRGSPAEADGFFVELLAETGGAAFGIEMAGPAPDRVRTSITDRGFLIDMFVELFEGQEAERSISRVSGEDFRAATARWLDGALQTRRDAAKRQLRRRDAQEG
ncbi:MAG TPA: hypothetical protein VGL62_05545 [Vicinamibacterales bacterium]|jgi:hypothetical protein